VGDVADVWPVLVIEMTEKAGLLPGSHPTGADPFFGGYPHSGYFGRGWPWGPPELQALGSEAAEVARLLASAIRGALDDRERLAHLRDLLECSRTELLEMIYGPGRAESTDSPLDLGKRRSSASEGMSYPMRHNGNRSFAPWS